MYSITEKLKHYATHSRLVLKKMPILPRVASGYFKTLVLKQTVLRTIEIAVTSECNSNCEMCYASKIKKPNDRILSVEEYKSIWAQAKKLGAFSVIVSGGEPSLRPDLLDIIQAFEPSKSLIAFVTNSIKIDKEFLLNLGECGVNTFHFSLDSLDPDENDKIRGYSGHYQKAVNAIVMAKQLGLNTYISTVIGHGDLKKMDLMVDFAKENGIGIVFSLACPTGNWAGAKEFVLTPEDWIKVQKKMSRNPHIRSDWTINFSLKVECPGGREKVAISPYGEVTGCGMNYISFGNVRDEPLEKIWKRMQAFPEFSRRPVDCLIGADQKYMDDYLIPLSGAASLPVRIHDHPKKPLQFEELESICRAEKK